MTTIALTKTQIASDLQFSHSNGFKFKGKTKLYTFENPLIHPVPFTVGYAGSVEGIVPVLDFLVDPTGFKKAPTVRYAEFVVLTADHKLYTFSDPTKWLQVDQPFYAIGSGATFALGAMATGATALDAVKAASKFDPMTGLGYRKVDYP